MSSLSRRRNLGLCALAAALTACTGPEPPDQPSTISADIRAFDFGDAEWHDANTASTVRLEGGLSHEDNVPGMPDGLDRRVLGPIVYTDLDADGDEDAAVGLQSTGGQMFSRSWYIWLWQDGTAAQITWPIAFASRCEGDIESVTAKSDAFAVSMVVMDEGDSCVTAGSIPITYEVGVRDGWPVRVRPRFGPIDTCNPRSRGDRVATVGTVRLHTAPDENSPEIGEFDKNRGIFLSDGPYFKPRDDQQWQLVTVAHAPEQVCGWAHRDDLYGD